jgi:methyl-accepting chemotaxis protein
MRDNQFTVRFGLITAVILIVFPLVSLTGCGQKDVRTIGSGLTPSDKQISKEDLRKQLDKFAEYFKARLRQMSGDLYDQAPNKRTEKTTLQMRARMIQGLNVMLDQEDSVIAFIETWALCSRFRAYLEEGQGASLYSDGQKIAVIYARQIEAEIEQIGHAFLKDDEFETAQKNINEFANANPIKSAFTGVTIFATEVQKGQDNPFMSVIKIPMTPFRAIEGVDRTATAVNRFTDTAERFSDIVNGLPESSRWQLQLLLYDLEETDMTKSFLSSIAQFSESSSRLSKSVEELPKQLREELTQLVEETDEKQENLRKTLEQAEKTTLAITNALQQLDKTSGSLGNVAKDITQTTQAWQSAAETTGDVIQELNKKKETPEKKQSFDIKEYRAAAEQTSKAANDIEKLLASIDGLLISQNYKRAINAATWRAIGFVLFVFAIVVLYRVISVRLIGTKSGMYIMNAENKLTGKRKEK